jgi:hypothetical protein
MAPRIERSLVSFVLLECMLSVPFWGIGAVAQAHVIPDRVLFRASWSLTPMMAAAILVYRENGAAGVRQLFRRIVDYARIRAKIWYLAVFLAGPIIVFVQTGAVVRTAGSAPAFHASGTHLVYWVLSGRVRGRTWLDGLRA